MRSWTPDQIDTTINEILIETIGPRASSNVIWKQEKTGSDTRIMSLYKTRNRWKVWAGGKSAHFTKRGAGRKELIESSLVFIGRGAVAQSRCFGTSEICALVISSCTPRDRQRSRIVSKSMVNYRQGQIAVASDRDLLGPKTSPANQFRRYRDELVAHPVRR